MNKAYKKMNRFEKINNVINIILNGLWFFENRS